MTPRPIIEICATAIADGCPKTPAVASSAVVQQEDFTEGPRGYVPKSINVRNDVLRRVIRCMRLDGVSVFSDFANAALAMKCRAIERDHEIDSKGNPVK